MAALLAHAPGVTVSALDVFAAPGSPRALRALRTGTGALALLGLLHAEAEWSPRLSLYAVGREGLSARIPWALWACALLASVGVTLGRAPRLSALVFCVSLAALHALAPQVYHNNYYVLWLFVLITALEPTDGPRAPWETGTSSAVTNLVPRLLQAQIALIYWLSVLAKLAHPWWREGGAVVRWIVTERVPNSGVQGIVNPLLSPALSVPALAAAAQTAILGVELLLPFMLFSRRWRRVGFAVGATMHTVMQEWLFPQLFTFLMLLGYYAFAPADDRAWTLRLNPSHPLHARLARALPALDWLARVRLETSPGAALALTGPSGSTRRGVPALWWLAALCPASVLAYAGFALIAPELGAVAGVPRATLENLVVMTVGVIGLIPGKGPSHLPGSTPVDGRKTSHPGSPGDS